MRLVDVGGEDARVWEHFHSSENPGQFLRALEAASAKHAGVAGPAFVYALIQARAKYFPKLAEIFDGYQVEIAIELGIDPQTDTGPGMRVCGHFAAIRLAGRLASECKILPQSRTDFKQAVNAAAHSWARIRGIGRYELLESPLAILRAWILPRIGKHLLEVDSDTVGKLHGLVGRAGSVG